MTGIKEEIKKTWNWLWNSDSILSYIALLIVLFIVIKFIFLPGLGLVLGSKLPLAIVESSSMDHHALDEGSGSNLLCGTAFPEARGFNFEEYWVECGGWYETRNISKEQFKEFRFKNGFRKGDIMLMWGWKKVEIGDVIVYNAGRSNPIIHRVISLDPLATKGDHNSDQLTPKNNLFGTDETNISSDQVIGTAVLRIPYLGWIKLFFVELFNGLSS